MTRTVGEWRARLRAVLGDRIALALGGLLGVAYLVVYLWVIGDLALHGRGGWMLRTVADPWGTLWSVRGPFYFEAIMVAEIGPATWLVSPLNLALGAFLAGLVALNIAAGTTLARSPKACGFTRGAGALASLPALLAGSACCAPAVALLLGIQMSVALLSLFQWLIPLAVALMVGTLIWTLYQLPGVPQRPMRITPFAASRAPRQPRPGRSSGRSG